MKQETDIEKMKRQIEGDNRYYLRLTIAALFVGLFLGAVFTWGMCYVYFMNGGSK